MSRGRAHCDWRLGTAPMSLAGSRAERLAYPVADGIPMLLPEHARDPKKLWYGATANYNTPAWNTKFIKREELPKSWEEFAAKKEWKGHVAIDGHEFHWLRAMVLHFGEEKGRKLLGDFVRNLDPVIVDAPDAVALDPERMAGAVRFREVSFRYPEGGKHAAGATGAPGSTGAAAAPPKRGKAPFALAGIDFEARPGEPVQQIPVDAEGRVGLDFGVYGVPETYVLDRAGHIRRRYVGQLTNEILERDLLPLLRALAAKS